MNPYTTSLFVTPAIVCTMAASCVMASEINAADYGVVPGSKDNGAAMLKLIDAARTQGTTRIRFAPGEYHFHAESALPMNLFISNHDQQDVHPVAVPLVDLKNLELRGKKTKFIFHGKMLPFVLMDCQNVTISNISIDAAEPFSSEGRIVEIKDGKTIAALYAWAARNK